LLAAGGLALLVAGVLSGLPVVTASAATVPITVELATYHGDLSRDGYSPDTAIRVGNVAGLQEIWAAHAAGAISGQPAVVNGIAYWGDWAGEEHATNPAGKNLWSTYLGQTNAPGCNPSTVGIASSPTVGTVSGTKVVITGGGAGDLAELRASTGAVVWETRIAPLDGGFVWSSPVLYDGSVYIGMSSFGDCPLVASGVFMVNAATGAVEHEFPTVPAGGCLGGGVWSSPAVDPAEDALFVTTGNTTCTTPLQDAMLKLSLANLALLGSWAVPADQRVSDSDWGSSPTLFTADIGDQLEQLVGSADKNGTFYALNTTSLSRGPVWEYQIAQGGGDPQRGNGSIAPATFDGTTLYVAGGTTTIDGNACLGSVDALDPATGQPVWQDCLDDGPVLAALTSVPGVVLATTGPALVALHASNGDQLFEWTDANRTAFYGPAVVSGPVVLAGNTDGNLFAWAVPWQLSVRR
jgi:polyvinyl alcohol dehydrogenase (cytochrome)